METEVTEVISGETFLLLFHTTPSTENDSIVPATSLLVLGDEDEADDCELELDELWDDPDDDDQEDTEL